MAQMQELGKTATSVFTDEDGFTKVIYHSTVVVKWDNETIILNTGGWSTTTTKARMNQASNQFKLGYRVYQKDYDWFVEWRDKTVKFNQEVIINAYTYQVTSDIESETK